MSRTASLVSLFYVVAADPQPHLSYNAMNESPVEISVYRRRLLYWMHAGR
jgi:hypothetical protein